MSENSTMRFENLKVERDKRSFLLEGTAYENWIRSFLGDEVSHVIKVHKVHVWGDSNKKFRMKRVDTRGSQPGISNVIISKFQKSEVPFSHRVCLLIYSPLNIRRAPFPFLRLRELARCLFLGWASHDRDIKTLFAWFTPRISFTGQPYIKHTLWVNPCSPTKLLLFSP